MANYGSGKRTNWAAVLAAVLGVLLVLSILFGIGYNFGWFSKTDDEEDTEETKETTNTIISEGESNGIKLLSTTLKSTGTAESTYNLEATITPSYATNPELTWSIAWDTSWSGYNSDPECDSEDVYNDGWYSGVTSDIDISDYVTLSATTGSSITVSCYKAFGNPLIITCSTTDGSDLSATCKVDYQSYYTGLKITDCSSVEMSSSSVNRGYVTLSASCTIGTIASSGTLVYNSGTPYGYTDYTYNGKDYSSSGYLALFVRDNLGGTTYTDSDAWDYNWSSGSVGSISGYSIEKVFSYSTNWTTFVEELIDGYGSYIYGNDAGYSYSDYGEYALLDFYNAVSYCGVSNFHPFGWSYTLTDDKTGESFTASTNFTFSSLDGYPTYSVASLSIPSNIIF